MCVYIYIYRERERDVYTHTYMYHKTFFGNRGQHVTTYSKMWQDVARCGKMWQDVATRAYLKQIRQHLGDLRPFHENPVCPDPVWKPVSS